MKSEETIKLPYLRYNTKKTSEINNKENSVKLGEIGKKFIFTH